MDIILAGAAPVGIDVQKGLKTVEINFRPQSAASTSGYSGQKSHKRNTSINNRISLNNTTNFTSNLHQTQPGNFTRHNSVFTNVLQDSIRPGMPSKNFQRMANTNTRLTMIQFHNDATMNGSDFAQSTANYNTTNDFKKRPQTAANTGYHSRANTEMDLSKVLEMRNGPTIQSMDYRTEAKKLNQHFNKVKGEQLGIKGTRYSERGDSKNKTFTSSNGQRKKASISRGFTGNKYTGFMGHKRLQSTLILGTGLNSQDCTREDIAGKTTQSVVNKTVEDFVPFVQGNRYGEWAQRAYKAERTRICGFNGLSKPHFVHHIEGNIDYKAGIGFKKVNFTIEEALKKKDLPPPNMKHIHWKPANDLQKWQSSSSVPKCTFIGQILKTKTNLGPGRYKIKYDSVQKRVQQVTKSKNNIPQLQMFDHVKAVSKDTPAPNTYKKSHKITDKKPFEARIHKVERVKDVQLTDSRSGTHARVHKSSEAGPGHYKNAIPNLEKSCEVKKEFMFPKGARVTHFDKIKIRSKLIPGVGAYAKKEHGIDRCLSAPCTSLRRRR